MVSNDRATQLLRSLWNSEFVFFVLLCVVSFLHSYHFFDFRPDPDHWDEISVYIDHINWNWLSALSQIEVSPLYTLWYSFLNLFATDYLELYYLNSLLLTFSIPLVLYILARRHGLSRIESFLGFVGLLLYAPLITLNRFPNHFLFFFVSLGFILISFIQGFFRKLWCVGFLVLLSVYIRPEMILSFAGIFVFIIFYSIYRFLKKRLSLKQAFGVLMLLAGGILSQRLLGQSQQPDQPLKSEDTFRIYNEQRLAELVPDAKEQYQIRYSHPKSIQQALLNNPVEFFHHVVFSAKQFRNVAVFTLTSYSYLLQKPACLWLGIFILFIIFGVWRYREDRPVRNWHWLLLFSLLLMTPFFVSALIVGTIPRYLLPFVACGLLWISILITPKIEARGLILALGLLFLQCLYPLQLPTDDAAGSTFHYYGEDAAFGKTCGSSIEITQMLKSLKADKTSPNQLRVLSQMSLYNYVGVEGLYLCGTAGCCTEQLPEASFSISEFRKKVYNFNAFISAPHFEEFAAGDFLSEKKRQAFIDLVNSPEKYGFKAIRLRCPEEIFLIDKNYFNWRMNQPP